MPDIIRPEECHVVGALVWFRVDQCYGGMCRRSVSYNSTSTGKIGKAEVGGGKVR